MQSWTRLPHRGSGCAALPGLPEGSDLGAWEALAEHSHPERPCRFEGRREEGKGKRERMRMNLRPENGHGLGAFLGVSQLCPLDKAL